MMKTVLSFFICLSVTLYSFHFHQNEAETLTAQEKVVATDTNICSICGTLFNSVFKHSESEITYPDVISQCNIMIGFQPSGFILDLSGSRSPPFIS